VTNGLHVKYPLPLSDFDILIYLLTAIWLSPDGRSTVHIYTQTIHKTSQKFWKCGGRAPSWLVIPWHLPYNRGKTFIFSAVFRKVLKHQILRKSVHCKQLFHADRRTDRHDEVDSRFSKFCERA